VTEIMVHRFTEDDLPAVTAGLGSRAPDVFRRRLRHQAEGGLTCFVAWLGETPVGYVGVNITDDRSPDEMIEARGYALVEDLFVEEAYRRRGAARALMLALEAHAQAAGMPGVILDTGTNDSFAAARALYRSLGYVDQENVYLGGWSDPDHPGVHFVDPLTTWLKPF
jgi:GNAT superfamily N-acetyltransferase